MNLRQTNLERLAKESFDVLIIGAGINGAIAAAALSTQGAHVALIDRGDFASLTSQESSNLVWGGIKYLESFEFGLVRKLCRCRNELIASYPASVREIRFLVTLARGFRWPRSMLYAGAWFYWLIGSGFTRTPRLLSRSAISREEPVVNVGNSPGGFEYSDAYLIDNDARFTFRFVRGALDYGAVVANYAGASHSTRGPDGFWVTPVTDSLTGSRFRIRSRTLINACGPYVDAYNTASAQPTRHCHVLSKGIHIIVKRLSATPRVLTFFASDGRLFFVIPMGPVSCIGTTDTRVASPETIVSEADRRFVLDNINQRLRLAKPLTPDDILAERCGVRPLAVRRSQGGTATQDWTALSRKHVIELDPRTGYMSIFGGKLTDCLNVGREVSAALHTFGIRLPFRRTKWYGEPDRKIRDEFLHRAALLGLDAMTAPESSEPMSKRLWRRYGWRALSLLEDIRQDPRMAEVLIKGTEYTRCELYHAAQHEMVTRLEDFLRRRSKIALIARRDTIRQAPGLMEACRILFGDDAQAHFEEYFAAKS